MLATTDDAVGFSFDSTSMWREWALKQPWLTNRDVEELASVLAEDPRLDDGTIIAQEFNPRVKKMVMLSTCVDHEPRIQYDPASIAALSPPALLFMKTHELGHFGAQHIDCARNSIKPDYTEKEADCWAVAHLLQRGAAGLSAIDAAQQYLYDHNASPQGRYLAGRQRSAYLRDRCLSTQGMGGAPPPR